jgi:hypothetical protein
MSDFSKQTELLQKWFDTWNQIGERIQSLPEWMQTILLDDLNTAIVNRVTVMELILNAQTNP